MTNYFEVNKTITLPFLKVVSVIEAPEAQSFNFWRFSFTNYYNPTRMGFGKLRVVNNDWVKPGIGFPSHPHRNMEIISFIRSGLITH